MDAELSLTGSPSADANRISTFSEKVPSSSNYFRRQLYFELRENYSDYHRIKKVLTQAASQGAEFSNDPTNIAKEVADTPFEDVMENRSRKARIADRSTTATNTTSDFAEWASQPNRRDYPGVDTLSEEIRAQRIQDASQTALDKGITRDIKVHDELYGGGAAGEFSQGSTEIMIAADRRDTHRHLAHELGHALDFAATDNADKEPGKTYGSQKAFEEADDTLVKKAANELSDIWDERGRDKPLTDTDYLNDPRELAADFAALAIEDPQRARNRAPNAQEVFSQAGILDTLTDVEEADGSVDTENDDGFPTPEQFRFEERTDDVFDTSGMKDNEEMPFFR